MGERFGRRTLVEWLGKGAVLALGAPLLEACAGAVHGEGPDSGAPGPDAGAGGADAGAPGQFPFQPGDGTQSIFWRWGERTVDEQSLTRILATWKLTVDGMVGTPRTFGFADLLSLPRTEQVTDFHCVEGWSVYDVPWDGLRLADLLELVQPLASATHVSVGCRGGIYTESLPLAVAHEPKTLLALGVAGHTLPVSHGFPARLVVPRLLGYKNPKYVETLTLADHELVGFWPKYGYPVSGEVPPERLRPGKY